MPQVPINPRSIVNRPAGRPGLCKGLAVARQLHQVNVRLVHAEITPAGAWGQLWAGGALVEDRPRPCWGNLKLGDSVSPPVEGMTTVTVTVAVRIVSVLALMVCLAAVQRPHGGWFPHALPTSL